MLTCAREPPCGPTVIEYPGFLVDRVGSAIVCELGWVGLTIADNRSGDFFPDRPSSPFSPAGPHACQPDDSTSEIQISSAMSVLGHVACRSQVPKFRDTHMRLTQIRSAGRSSSHGESAVRRWLYLDVNTIHNSMAVVAAPACVWERVSGYVGLHMPHFCRCQCADRTRWGCWQRFKRAYGSYYIASVFAFDTTFLTISWLRFALIISYNGFCICSACAIMPDLRECHDTRASIIADTDTHVDALRCDTSALLPSTLKVPRTDTCCSHRLVQRILCVARHTPLGESPTAREIR